jgi:hypothetical protein
MKVDVTNIADIECLMESIEHWHGRIENVTARKALSLLARGGARL